MIPVIALGPVEISSYWLMLGVGTVGMLISLLYRRGLYGLTRVKCVIFTLLLTITGVVGAKVLYILENLQSTLENGISLGGVSFFGSVYLILLLMPLIGQAFSLKGSQTLDMCAPCVAIMIGCMRVGCFFSGCCGGWEVCLWDICFHWPTQAIESIGDFLILGMLLQREEQHRTDHLLYPLFMLEYGILRFFVEFLRDTPKETAWMSNGQWFALASILIGAMWLVRVKKGVLHEKTKIK